MDSEMARIRRNVRNRSGCRQQRNARSCGALSALNWKLPVDSPLQIAAAQLAIALTVEQSNKLIRLLDELDDWNQRMNLTAIRERPQQLTKHVLDSLSIQSFL